ncbi:MAG: sorbosone dehydrogenase family protein [Chthoniobacterales bacterium]
MTFPKPFLLLPLLAALAALAARAELPAQGPAGDWSSAKPGKEYRITPADLPPPYATEFHHNTPKIVPRPDGAMPQVPADFQISEWASGLDHPRYLLTAPNGDIFVTESKPGRIRVLRDTNGDGSPDLNEVFADGLNRPFGLAFSPPGPDPEHLYVANTGSVVRFPYANGDTQASDKPETITELSEGGHLEGGGHWTRDICFSKDGKKLFVAIGSKTNVDKENLEIEQHRARILIMNPDGSEKAVYATGLRNPVGIAVHPETGDLWTSVNERDGLGDNLVPDYITHVKPGAFYGWPYFYIGPNPDPHHEENPHTDLADTVTVPDVLVQSHSATLNLAFYTGDQFPEEYRNDIFAAFHGSWNRGIRTGYKVVRVPLDEGRADGTYEDFVTGFVTDAADVWGRPVGLTVAKDGSLLISEDAHNTIWRVSRK